MVKNILSFLVTIPVANISTGIDELDQHLKGNLFFDVEQFPTATFSSDSVAVSGESAKVTAGFSATATTKRSDFGITTLLPSLGDEVKLDIEAEAYKENK